MSDEASSSEMAVTVSVCFTRCYPCQFGEHRDPPKWHTWAAADDIDHALATGQPDPAKSRCGCYCARDVTS